MSELSSKEQGGLELFLSELCPVICYDQHESTVFHPHSSENQLHCSKVQRKELEISVIHILAACAAFE